jgi:hypothetical protein
MPVVVLPSLHAVLCFLTLLVSRRTPGGAWYRLVGIDFPLFAFAMPLRGFDGELAVFAIVLLLGTSWWYLIGRVGWSSHIGRLRSSGATVLALSVSLIGPAIWADTFHRDIREAALKGVALTDAVRLQYLLVGLLCIGALLSAISSATAVWTKHNRG